tara:strand:+ start:351 stop:647 length:297 start_codon:yes stop_codon:yes gene_type:complete
MIGKRRKVLPWEDAIIRTTRVAVLLLDALLLDALSLDALSISGISSGASAKMILPLFFVPLESVIFDPLSLIVTRPLCLHRPAVTNGAAVEEEAVLIY